MKNIWIILLGLTLTSVLYADAVDKDGYIDELYIRNGIASGTQYVRVKLKDSASNDNCGSTYGYILKLDEHIASNKIFTSLLMAKASNSKIRLYSDSGCYRDSLKIDALKVY